MKSMYVKKIGAIVAGAAMLGAGLSGAVSAGTGDLNKDFFYTEDMTPNVTLVIGENAQAVDAIAAANLAATIGNLAYTTETIKSDPVTCKATETSGVCDCSGAGSVILETTTTGYRGLMDQDDDPDRCPIVSQKEGFYTLCGVIFDGAEDNNATVSNECIKTYSDKEGNFKQISTTEICESRTDQTKIEVLLDRDYANNQCYLCYDICQETVTDVEHEMFEQIDINKCEVRYFQDGLDNDDVEESLRMRVGSEAIKYSVYTDYLPPNPIMSDAKDLIDSAYKGKMIFLGQEYYVKDWDGKGKLELARGAERKLDNKAFGGSVTLDNGDEYSFKVQRALYSGEGQVAGVIIAVKKPDGTEQEVLAKKHSNAVIGGIEIYASNVAATGEFIQADVKIYDLKTEIILEDGEYLDNSETWMVDMETITLGQLIDGNISDATAKAVGESKEETKKRFSDYKSASDGNKESHNMLQWVHLILDKEYKGDDALEVGDKIPFPLDTFEFSYEGYKTDNFVDGKCSGGSDEIVIEKEADHQVLISFTDNNGDRYNDVHLDQGPYKSGDYFMVKGKVYKFEDAKNADYGQDIKIKDMAGSSDVTEKFILTNTSMNIIYKGFCGLICAGCEADGKGNEQASKYYAGTINGFNSTYVNNKLYVNIRNLDTVSMDPSVVGTVSVDVENNPMAISIVHETNATGNINDAEGTGGTTTTTWGDNRDDQDGNTNDVLIKLEHTCMGATCECNCIGEVGASCSDDTCKPDTTSEIAYIDFYDDDNDSKCDTNVVVMGKNNASANAIVDVIDGLNDEDDEDTIWMPSSGTKITVEWDDEKEFNRVTICHPTEQVYQTYFIGSGKNETKSEIRITDSQIGQLIPEIGYTLKDFDISSAGAVTTTNATATITTPLATNITATCVSETHKVATGKLVVSDKESATGNLIVVGGNMVNTRCTASVCDGQGTDHIKMDGGNLYIAGYTGADTQKAVTDVINWLKANAHA